MKWGFYQCKSLFCRFESSQTCFCWLILNFQNVITQRTMDRFEKTNNGWNWVEKFHPMMYREINPSSPPMVPSWTLQSQGTEIFREQWTLFSQKIKKKRHSVISTRSEGLEVHPDFCVILHINSNQEYIWIS